MKLATTHPHAFGMLVTALGVLVFVPDALLLRLIGGDMLAVSVWRGLLAGSVFLIWSYGISNASRLTLRDSLSGLCLLVAVLEGASMILFCASIGHTSVSNALFIFATAPLIAAALSWVFLRETVPVQTLMAIIVSMIGVIVIVSGSFGGASLLGDGLAFLNACTVAGLCSFAKNWLQKHAALNRGRVCDWSHMRDAVCRVSVLFNCADWVSVCKWCDYSTCRDRIAKHWSTLFTRRRSVYVYRVRGDPGPTTGMVCIGGKPRW